LGFSVHVSGPYKLLAFGKLQDGSLIMDVVHGEIKTLNPRRIGNKKITNLTSHYEPKGDDFLYIVDAYNIPNNNIIVTMPTKKQVTIKVKSNLVESPIETTTVDGLFSELNSAKPENKKRLAPITSVPTLTESVVYRPPNMFEQHTHKTNFPKHQVTHIVQSKAPVELSAPQTNPQKSHILNTHNFHKQEQQPVTLMPSALIPLDNSNSFEAIFPDSVSPLNNLVPVNSYSSQYATDALYHINKKRKVAAEPLGYDNYSVSYYNYQPFATCKPTDVNHIY